MNLKLLNSTKSLLLLFLLQACIHSTEEIQFSPVSESELSELVEFAIESNDVYKTRKASKEVAREVFELQSYQVKERLIEKICKDGETIGFYALKKPSKAKDGTIEIELSHINVKTGHMRQGLGTSLYKRACERARSLQVSRMHWISDPDAEGFYRKQGARLIGHDENLLDPSVDVPLFETILN